MRVFFNPVVFAALLGVVLGLACQATFRDDITYRCNTDTDCAGDGFKCAKAAAAAFGSCCKPTGEEVCDKVDNDCDGLVDNTGKVEVCNGLDDNCDGRIDEGFDLDHDPENCGRCDRHCRSTEVCRNASCLSNVETICYDGLDDNNNGKIDCADVDCEQRPCGAGCTCHELKQTESKCDDNVDNDHDGHSDCHDLDCVGRSCAAGCTCVADGGQIETDCTDGVDNDGDGLKDCLDPDCVGRFCTPPQIFFQCTASQQCKCNGGVQVAEVGSVLCRDDIDNDCNGVKDCGEATCDGQSCAVDGGTDCVCAHQRKAEHNCTNLLDDDGDALVDCADQADCPQGTVCTRDGGSAGTCNAQKSCEL